MRMQRAILRCRPAQATLLAALLVCLVGAACESAPEQVYKLYPGPQRETQQLARVRVEGLTRVRIDGLAVDHGDWAAAEVEPGEHRIGWESAVTSSLMGEPTRWAAGTLGEGIQLLAGHRYVVRTVGLGDGSGSWGVVLVDEDTDAVLARGGGVR